MLSTMERILQLKKIPLFSEFQVRELTAIASIAQEKAFPAGTKIIQEGEVGESLYLVLSGRVSVIKELGLPRELHIADIGPDDYFGEMALFDRQPRSASVVAQEETHVLELSRFEFEEIVKEFPQIAIDACRVFSQRLRELQQRFPGSGSN
jgi:CRP-like cAMP-binding protein